MYRALQMVILVLTALFTMGGCISKDKNDEGLIWTVPSIPTQTRTATPKPPTPSVAAPTRIPSATAIPTARPLPVAANCSQLIGWQIIGKPTRVGPYIPQGDKFLSLWLDAESIWWTFGEDPEPRNAVSPLTYGTTDYRQNKLPVGFPISHIDLVVFRSGCGAYIY